MKLNAKALAITFGLLWGGAVFLVALCHRFSPDYGVDFLRVVASIYPGYHIAGMKMGIVGTLYAMLDGAVCGFLIAWLYNKLSDKAA